MKYRGNDVCPEMRPGLSARRSVDIVSTQRHFTSCSPPRLHQEDFILFPCTTARQPQSNEELSRYSRDASADKRRTHSEHTQSTYVGWKDTTCENLCARAHTRTYLSFCLRIPGRTRQLPAHLAPLNLCMSGVPTERVEGSTVS